MAILWSGRAGVKIASFGLVLGSIGMSLAPSTGWALFGRQQQQRPPVNLESQRVTFKMSSGGTSCYAVISVDGKDVGAFLPHNSATNPSTEAGYAGLARAMGIKGLFQSGTAFRINSGAVQKFKSMIDNAGSMPSARRTNCNEIKARIAKNPNSLDGVYKQWVFRPYGYDDIVASNAPKGSHPIMQALQANKAWPSDNQTLSFKGYNARVADLAAGHGVVMMFDALFGQWDRYSGGNVTVALDGNSKQFFIFAADNGGATVSSSSWTAKHVNWMSRYPYQVAQKFNELEAFLEGKTASFAGYKAPYDLIQGIGLVYDNSPETYRKQLLKNLKIIRTKVEQNVAAYGQSKAYYNVQL